MICIGIVGDVSENFIRQIENRYIEYGYSVYLYCGNRAASDIGSCLAEAERLCKEVFISKTDSYGILKFDILIFNNIDKKKILSKMKNIKPNGYAIINADDCSIFPYILPENVNIITCGINSNASVTFSAISEYKNGREKIQCCIQRTIRTVSGKYIEPQEFGVNVRGKYPLSDVLLIITAAIATDIAESVTDGLLFS